MSDTARRKCSVEGCTDRGIGVIGRYMVGPRQVRVWACLAHYAGVENPLQILPTPAGIVAALEAEEREREEAARRIRVEVVDLDRRSVHAYAPTGHGRALRGDRVAAWRWGA